MVVLSETYLQHLEHKAIAEALTIHIQTKTFKRYVDSSHARFLSKQQANTFQEILNKHHQKKHHQKCIERFPLQSTLDMFRKICQRRRKIFNQYVL